MGAEAPTLGKGACVGGAWVPPMNSVCQLLSSLKEQRVLLG